VSNISAENAEPPLTLEILEAVLNPERLLAHELDQAEIILTRQHFVVLIGESPQIQRVVDGVCDFLRPDPESIKREALNYGKDWPETENVAKWRNMEPEFFFRRRIIKQLETFFRAGWEARYAAERLALRQEEERKRETAVGRSLLRFFLPAYYQRKRREKSVRIPTKFL